MCALGLASVGYAQMGGVGGGIGGGGGMGGGGMGGGIGSISGTPYGGATDPSTVEMKDGYRIIPSIGVAERYDSNVFYQRKGSGLDRSDYVTSMAPQIRGLFGGRAMTVNAVIGAVAEYYVKNTNFNYVGANAGLGLDLSPMLDRFWKGMTFQVSDAFRYTPQPPSFLVGNQDSNATTPFTRGQQVARVSLTSNVVGASVNAPLNQTVSLTGAYSRGFIQFGTSDVPQNGRLLDTTYQTFSAGVSTQVSPQDSVTLSYLESSYKTEDGAQGTLTARGGTLAWMHTFSPSVTLNTIAGVQVRSGGFGGSSSASATASSRLTPIGGLTLLWKDQTTSVSLLYSVTLVPSYQFQAQPLLSNAVSLTMVQRTLIPELVGLLNVNYGRGDEFGSTSSNPISYESYSVGGGIVYEFTQRTFVNLNASYAKYDSQFGVEGFSFPRTFVGLSMTKAFY